MQTKESSRLDQSLPTEAETGRDVESDLITLEKDDTKYPVMVDPVAFDHKPTNPETRDITNRLKYQNTVQHMTAEQLRTAITQGHTVCLGCFDPCKQGEKFGQSRFIGQRIVAVDIDNTEDGRKLEFWEYGFLSIPRAIDRAVYGLGQTPLVVYESFGSTDEHSKFRLLFDLGYTETDYEEAHSLILDVLETYPEADRNGKCSRPDALFFGTSPANGRFWDTSKLREWGA